MRSRETLGLAALLCALSCASVEDQRASDRAQALELARDRLGMAFEAPLEGAQSAPAIVNEMLAAPLTDSSAVQIALSSSPRMRSALARLGVASAERIQAGLLSNPVVSASAKFFDGGTEIELGLVESFVDLLLRSTRARVAESELTAVRSEIVLEVLRLAHDVRRELARVSSAHAVRMAAVEHWIATETAVELMRSLHVAGNVVDNELSAVELVQVQAKLDHLRAQEAETTARERLGALLGMAQRTPTLVIQAASEETVEQDLDIESIEAGAVQASLDLAALRARATAEARRAGIVGYEAVLGPMNVGLVAKREAESGDWGLGPALGFSLPVFDGGGARRAAAKARIEALHAEHVAREVEIRSGARILAARLRSAGERVQILRDEQLAIAGRLVVETLRNYNAMQIGAFAVLQAKQRHIQARSELIRAAAEVRLARIDLDELQAGGWNPDRLASSPYGAEPSMSKPIESSH